MADGVTVDGAQEAASRLRRFPVVLEQAHDSEAREVATEEVPRIKAAGQRSDRQSALAARSVMVRNGMIVGGAGTGPAAAVFFGAEFGGRRRRTTRQFRPFRGQRGYWFFEQLRDDATRIDDHWQAVVDDLEREWAR